MDWLSSPISPENDTELIGRLRRRDPAAAAEMYERYGRLLYALILNILGDREDSEDLLAEAILKASNQIQTLQADDFALGPWLLILARNHALRFREEMRDKKRAQNWSSLESAALQFRAQSGDDAQPATAAAQQVFWNLPATSRLVLELAWFEGLSFDEISLRLHVPLAEVVASAKDSLARMREC